MKRFNKAREPEITLAWQILSFLALEPSVQVTLIGPAAPWFCEERPYKNTGANYLMGVMLVYMSYSRPLEDRMYPDVAVMEALDTHVRAMLANERSPAWCQEALAHHADWQLARELAQQILAQCGLPLNPPARPFWFPDLIEVEGYQPESVWRKSRQERKPERGWRRRVRHAERKHHSFPPKKT